MPFYRETQRFGNGTRVMHSLWSSREAVDEINLNRCFLMSIVILTVPFMAIFIICQGSSINKLFKFPACSLLYFLFIFIIGLLILCCINCNRRRNHQVPTPSTRQEPIPLSRQEPVVRAMSEIVPPSAPPPPLSSIYMPQTTAPSDDCTPPPSYQEAILAILQSRFPFPPNSPPLRPQPPSIDPEQPPLQSP